MLVQISAIEKAPLADLTDEGGRVRLEAMAFELFTTGKLTVAVRALDSAGALR